MVGNLQPFDTAIDGTAFWSTNTNVEKTSLMKSAPAWGGFRRARLVQCMARLRLSRLSEKMSLALRAGGLVCGSTVDSTRRAKDVAG